MGPIVRVSILRCARDTFAEIKLIRSVCHKLGSRATLHIIESADHSFHVLKSSGKTDSEVMQELAKAMKLWAERILEK